VQENRIALSHMKRTMVHASAEHSLSLNDMKKVVRESSLEKFAVEKERTDRQIEIKKACSAVWVRVPCWNTDGVMFIVGVKLTGLYFCL
jgi:hypothetical protein